MAAMDEIQSEFADLDLEVTDEDVLAELAVLCQRYNIDATKISCEYFAFATNTKQTTNNKLLLGQPPTLESLGFFESDKLKSLKPAGARRPLDPIEGASNLPDTPDLAGCEATGTPTRVVTKRHVTPDTHLAKRLVTALGTPGLAGGTASQPSSPAPAVTRKYTERSNKGEVVVRHNCELAGDWEGEGCKASLGLPAGALAQPYRFMYERLRDRAAVLDETICRVGDRLVAGLGREGEGVMDLASTRPEPGLAVGRVQCDGEGRLNSNSVVLQGGLEAAGGTVLPVDLSQAPLFSLFPGQVVAMDCTNPNGSKLVAQALHPAQLCGPQAPASLPRGHQLSLLAACGPFTTSDSSSLEPLEDFLAVLQKEKPSVAVLLGPFLDAKNSQVVDSDQNFDTQWHRLLSLVAERTAGLETEVVLVSSCRDVHSLPIYPQPPLPVEDPATRKLLRPNLRLVSDPCTLTVSGVTLGISSTDILFHLGKEEISFPARSGDRMSRLASHLLTQGSFYPLYPPSEDLNVDYEQLELKATMDRAPHLLLLPSDLSHFVREVEGCTVVNPGRLTRGQGPGTFARLRVRRREEGEALDTRVEVVRI